MSVKYQAYAEYKDSGVEWLGNIPMHWKARQLKYLCTYNDEVLAESVGIDYEIEYVDIGSVSATDGIKKIEAMTFSKAPSRARRIVRDGDVIVSTVRTYPEAIAPIDNPSDNLIVSTGFAVIRPNKYLYKGYAAYCLRANGFIKEVVAQSVGISYPAINASDLVNIKGPEPTYDEQVKIANFLDHETAKIDTLIEKQQQLIKLLKEKRQAVISHAVTKGLNPNAPMRDSGVEWLGEVPEHWEVKRFKNLFKIRKRIAGELGYDVLSITQKGIKIKDIESGEGQLSMDYSKYQLVYKGDYAMNHMDLLTGFVDISEYDGVTSPDYRVFTLEDKTSIPEYFLCFLQMGYINKLFFPFGQGAAHIGRWRLPTEAFNEFLAPCPPEEEQKKIAEFIVNNLKKMSFLEEKAVSVIKLMQERRTALISAALKMGTLPLCPSYGLTTK